MSTVDRHHGLHDAPGQPATARYEVLRERLTLILGALADTPSIAEHLAAQGIKGRRGQPRDCPLGHYLTRELGHQVQVGMTTAFMIGVRSSTFASGAAPLPEAVRLFRINFDAGRYPELDCDEYVGQSLDRLIKALHHPAVAEHGVVMADPTDVDVVTHVLKELRRGRR